VIYRCYRLSLCFLTLTFHNSLTERVSAPSNPQNDCIQNSTKKAQLAAKSRSRNYSGEQLCDRKRGWSRDRDFAATVFCGRCVYAVIVLIVAITHCIFLPCAFYLLMAALCNRADHYIFALWFLSSIFFPRLISAATDWMSTILLHMTWP